VYVLAAPCSSASSSAKGASFSLLGVGECPSALPLPGIEIGYTSPPAPCTARSTLLPGPPGDLTLLLCPRTPKPACDAARP